MRIDESVKPDRSYPDLALKRSSALQINHKSGVSREERFHLLEGKAQAPAEEKSSNTYSERAQLLTNYSRTRHSWVA